MTKYAAEALPAATLDFSGVSFDAAKVEKIAEDTLSYADEHPAFQAEALAKNLELALHEDFTRAVILQGDVLEYFLRRFLAAFPYTPGQPVEKKELDKRLSVAFEEQAVSMHRLIIRRALKGEFVSLGDVTDIVLAKPRNSNFNKVRKRVRNKYFVPMEELWRWEISDVERVNRNG